MTKQEAMRQTHLYNALRSLGFDDADCGALRRVSLTLRRWFELECGTDNGAIERDEKTGKPYFVNANASGRRYRVADREAGAMRRLARIMATATTPGLSTYIQGDPRGAALYIIRPGDIPPGATVDSCYSRGICIY